MAVPNQEKGQWQPGQSGNPSGRKEGSKNRSTVLKKWLSVDCSFVDVLGNENQGTIEDKVAIALINRAIKGDVPAAKEILDSVYGKVGSNEPEMPEITVILPKMLKR